MTKQTDDSAVDANDAETIETLFPGTSEEMETTDGRKFRVLVYPVGFIHIREFAGKLTSVFGVMTNPKYKELGTDAIASQLTPLIVGDLGDLIAQTYRIESDDEQVQRIFSKTKFEKLPHQVIARITKMWVTLNLTKKNIDEWTVLFTTAMGSLKEVFPSISATQSKPSSPPAGPGATSSKRASRDSRTQE